MACEPNDLISLARCFSCLTPTQLLAVQTYLLCQIVSGGGIGGGGTVSDADPTGTGSDGDIWFNKTNGTLWFSDGTAWIQHS